jgi:hypothetical protein
MNDETILLTDTILQIDDTILYQIKLNLFDAKIFSKNSEEHSKTQSYTILLRLPMSDCVAESSDSEAPEKQTLLDEPNCSAVETDAEQAEGIFSPGILSSRDK